MIVVTGANGNLGQLVIQDLLQHVPAADIVAAVRSPEKAANLARLGVQLRHADYNQPATLAQAFAGATKLLLISSSEVGQRVTQQKAVIDAGKAAGVHLLAYTSILRADTSTLGLAAEHLATEQILRSSGVPFVLLRNGWYLENDTGQLAPALAHGAILGASGEGRFASAARSDYAAAAVAVLTSPGHENKVYELAGDASFDRSGFAAELSRQAGKPIAFHNLPAVDFEQALLGFGLPKPIAGLLADCDLGAARGELDSSSHQLSELIGRPTVTLAEAIHSALKTAA